MTYLDYALIHAKAFIAFVDALSEESKPGDFVAKIGMHSIASIVSPDLVDCEEPAVVKAAARLADTVSRQGPSEWRVYVAETLAGVPYNESIGMLRMVVQYDIRIDRQIARLMVYCTPKPNGSGE